MRPYQSTNNSMLENLYNEAKEHKDNHKGCGGEPYKSYGKLFEVTKEFSEELARASRAPVRILEIGTAVGFTTFILQNATKNYSTIDTIEFHQEHVDLAKENIEKWGGDISSINFLTGDAKDILPNLVLENKKYDLIFFDGYGAKHIFYNNFEKLIEQSGIIITANKHLKSTEVEYFSEFLDTNKWEFIEEFADTVIYKKLN